LSEGEPAPDTMPVPDTPVGRAAARIRQLNEEYGFGHLNEPSLVPGTPVQNPHDPGEIAEARALLKANGWEEEVSGDWSPNPALGWSIDINREACSPAILRALAILAEEAQS
jgi:hypothetical protein